MTEGSVCRGKVRYNIVVRGRIQKDILGKYGEP